MKKNLLILMTLFVSIIGYSQTFTIQDTYNNALQFSVTSTSTVSLTTGSTINNTNVEIPTSVIDNGTTYSVTSINDYALGNKSIANISIPNTVTYIGISALSGNNLTGIVLPSSLETIGNYAFQNNQIPGLTIPSNVTNIGAAAFRNNPLTTITSLSTVPPNVVTDANGNDSFHVLNAIRSTTDLIIPAGTTGAYVTDTGALWTGFNTVTENLNTGDTYVYDYITFEVISVANSTVKAIDYNTAGGTVVDIPPTVPNGLITYDVVEIGASAFVSKGLTSITFTVPSNITNIGQYAFANNSISSIIIPDSVLTIDAAAFASNLSMTNLIIGDNVTSIGDYAFRFTALTGITIPVSVTNIGAAAFGIHTLTDVYSEAITPPTITTTGVISTDTFEIYRSNINLHIPSGTESAYLTDPGALWTGFNSVSTLSTSNFELDNQIKVITKQEGLKITSGNSAILEKYSIYNIAGAKVTSGKDTIISTETLSNGIYILELQFNTGSITKKFVK